MVMSQERLRLSVLAIMAVVGVVLLARLSTIALSEFFEAGRPSLSAILYGHNNDARLRLAGGALDADPPVTSAAKAYAADALASDPLSVRALQILALAAEEEERADDAQRLMRRASEITLRSSLSQAWALRDALRSGDRAAVVRILDRAYAVNGNRFGPVERLLPFLITDAESIDATAQALAGAPQWREAAIGAMLRNNQLFEQWAMLYDAMSSTGAPPTATETRAFLTAFIQHGRLDDARSVWSSSLARQGGGQEGELLPNANFENGLPNAPFDWSVRADPLAAVRLARENRRRVLIVDFFDGRVSASVLTRLLALAPGDYILSGSERASSFSTPRGLVWRVACRGGTPLLGETESMRSDTPWRRFEVRFTVPENCPYQIMELTLLARVPSEQEVRGIAAYADIALEKAAP